MARAAHWYNLAAENGMPEAQYRLGMLTENGPGTPRNEVEAAKWYGLAAEQGYAQAQVRLGSCYATGKGVPQDNYKAYCWLTLATKRSLRDAERQRIRLAPKLSAEDVTKAEQSAMAWKPKHGSVDKSAGPR